MKLSVYEWGGIPEEKPVEVWQSILDKLPRYSFFQTPEWLDLLSRSIPNSKNRTTWFRFSDNSEAVLPCLVLKKKLGFKKLESLPWGTYGAFVTECEENFEVRLQASLRLLMEWHTPVAEITTNPLISLSVQSFKTIQTRTTSILYINQPFEDIWQRFQSRTRTSIRKAQKNGVTVWKSDPATFQKAVHILERLYKKACESWHGVDTVPELFFETLKTISSSQIAIFVAELDSHAIAADLIFYGKKEVQYFAGASDRDYSSCQAPKLLMSEMIRDACLQNYQYFNLGSSGGLKGVEQFKRLFSAEEFEYYKIRFIYPMGF